MKVLSSIVVEKYNVSDINYLVTGIYFNAGEAVKKGQVVATLESSKAEIDVEATSDGFVYHALKTGMNVAVGQTIAVFIDASDNDAHVEAGKLLSAIRATGEDAVADLRISQKAKMLIDRNNVDVSNFAGKTMVKEADVLAYLEKRRLAENAVRPAIPDFIEGALILVGGFGGAKMCIDAIRSVSGNIIGIIDPALVAGEEVLGIPVLGGEDRLDELLAKGFRNIVISFSSLTNLPARYEKCKFFKSKGFNFPNIIHAKAVVEPSARMGEGNIILAMSMLGSNTVIGDYNYVNTGALLCHDSMIGSNNHFAPNSVIAGRVSVGDNTLIGMNVTTYFDITIGSNVTVSNGIDVYKNIPDFSVIKHTR